MSLLITAKQSFEAENLLKEPKLEFRFFDLCNDINSESSLDIIAGAIKTYNLESNDASKTNINAERQP